MDLKLKDGTVTLPSNQEGAARFIVDMFSNRGQLPDSDRRVEWVDFYESVTRNRDAVNVSEIRPFLEKSMEIMIREPVEPLMVVSSLFNRVMAKGLSHKIVAGAMGSVYASDIGESQPYPEVNFQIGGGVQTAWIGKSGIGAAFSDEALRYSTWDIMAMNLRLMGQAMVRHKEAKAIGFLRSLGTVYFDNANPTESIFGVLTGRGPDMAGNGTLAMEDLFRAIAHSSEEGFIFDTMLMHPLSYLQGSMDPVMRNMMMAHGGGSYFQAWQGNPGPRDPWSNGMIGASGPSVGRSIIPGGAASGESATPLASRPQNATSAPTLPSYFPWRMNIVVSPLVPYDPDNDLADIYLLSSGNVGLHLVDEELTSVQWREESTETVKVKLRERYGYAVMHEGHGVGLLKNVKVGRNWFDGTLTATTMEVVSEIDPDTAVV